MSRALEAHLLSLLPTYTEIPAALLDQASSLLAQSRHNAGTLKAEEEVARSYACCHMACERLKISLDLPPIQSRPPIPPRVYNRLYTHLDKTLPATPSKSARKRMPSSRARDDVFGSSATRTPSRLTPSKDMSLAQFRNETTPTKSGGKQPPPLAAKRKAGGPASTLAPWIRPTIQLLCRELDDERVGRTVLAGMQSIAAPHGRPTKDKWVTSHLTSLLAAVYLAVWSQLYVFEQGKDVGKREYVKIRKSILEVLDRAQEEVQVKEMDEDELWIGWEDITAQDVDEALDKLVGSEWQQGDWFTNIESLVRQPSEEKEEADMDVTMEDRDDMMSGRLHLQKGDTMLQSRWVVTDKKRQEYQNWKDDMLRMIDEAGTQDKMQVS